jgi:hypothetical protein
MLAFSARDHLPLLLIFHNGYDNCDVSKLSVRSFMHEPDFTFCDRHLYHFFSALPTSILNLCGLTV